MHKKIYYKTWYSFPASKQNKQSTPLSSKPNLLNMTQLSKITPGINPVGIYCAI